MSEKVVLKSMKCPTCGATLKAKNNTETITCVYCGNSVIPVTEAAPAGETAISASGVLRVEGIKTSSSALAYIELFFEEYDWESFSYAQSLSIYEIDKLVSSLKASSADDKNTWFACFKAIYVPFMHKVSGCKKILATVIEEYKNSNLDAYSTFDAYKRIAAMISACKDDIIVSLEKIVSNAAKYGASATELGGLNADIDKVRNLDEITLFTDVEGIPEIAAFISEENAIIAQSLLENGINAEDEYNRAVSLINQKKYVEALNILLLLNGYSDSEALIEKIDRYYLIDDVLEIEGNLYFFKKNNSEDNTLSLYPVIDEKIAKKPIIKNVGKIVTNYADIIYYLNGSNKLRKYTLSANTNEEVYKKAVSRKQFVVYGRKAFFVSNYTDKNNYPRKAIVELDLTTGLVTDVIDNIYEILEFKGNKAVYTASINQTSDEYQSTRKTQTNIINLETKAVVALGTKKIAIEGFINNNVAFTRLAPNKNNKNLYVKSLEFDEPEKLIEQNIFSFCNIIASKLFYYIGNSANKSLINANCDGTERKEWPLYISKLLFEQGGWIYFIREAGYNSILCKSRLDGSGFKVIASDIDSFVKIKNGYLYYINNSSTLVKVRMDGSNLQELCDDVERVLSVKEEKVIFVSFDDRVSSRVVKSIYAVDFSGSGKIKLAYDIKSAQEYDDNTVYYIASRPTTNAYETIDTLYSLDINTYEVEKLLSLKVEEQEEQKTPGFAIAMFIMAISFFIAFVGFAGGVAGLGVVGFLIGLVSLLIGVGIKSSEKGQDS